ncbi:hypothetical protein P7K49_019072 [Saguinus oedipus]|uniref:Uncharacterized protein n=1 Tax=Saguinus oedipus TaxID=9490 RepID=A0ABQ9UX55_SAGOE|nr:hypothetical protein P7K49_019072 [Saguinus oedipus]
MACRPQAVSVQRRASFWLEKLESKDFPGMMGRFLGEVDGAVMTQLLSMGVFSQ